LIAALGCGWIAPASAADSQPTVDSISKALICQCGGCNFPVGTCNHEQCFSRDQMKAMAAKEIAAGKSRATIMQDFVLQYGVKVLAAPPARGFNLMVWILPALAVVTGLVLVVILVRRWRELPAEKPSPWTGRTDAKWLEAVDEEMERLGLDR
jgi:cytochrome c-type biogenesis protein CcmH/NrfF